MQNQENCCKETWFGNGENWFENNKTRNCNLFLLAFLYEFNDVWLSFVLMFCVGYLYDSNLVGYLVEFQDDDTHSQFNHDELFFSQSFSSISTSFIYTLWFCFQIRSEKLFNFLLHSLEHFQYRAKHFKINFLESIFLLAAHLSCFVENKLSFHS